MDFWKDKDKQYRLKMIDVYNEQVNDLVKILPTFKIANATIHSDETSPHMHIVGVPIIENCTRGMKKQVGKSQLFTDDLYRNGIFTDDENEIANNIVRKVKPKEETNKDKNNRKKYDTRF